MSLLLLFFTYISGFAFKILSIVDIVFPKHALYTQTWMSLYLYCDCMCETCFGCKGRADLRDRGEQLIVSLAQDMMPSCWKSHCTGGMYPEREREERQRERCACGMCRVVPVCIFVVCCMRVCVFVGVSRVWGQECSRYFDDCASICLLAFSVVYRNLFMMEGIGDFKWFLLL